MEKYNSEVDRTYTELPYEDKLDYVRTVDDEEDSGCCNFTNQFYLMNSFAGTFTCIVIIQVSLFFVHLFWSNIESILFELYKFLIKPSLLSTIFDV
jgi:hypothetical protein